MDMVMNRREMEGGKSEGGVPSPKRAKVEELDRGKISRDLGQRVEDAINMMSVEPTVSSRPFNFVYTVSRNSEESWHLGLKAEELQKRCTREDLDGVANVKVLGDKAPPPSPPELPKAKVTEKELNPAPTGMIITYKNDAFGSRFQEILSERPIVLIRKLDTALNLNLDLFSSATLKDANPDHPIEVRTQYFQSADENLDASGNKSWACYSSRGETTLQEYAVYQASNLETSRRTKMIKFGTNLDLSDARKWKAQLQELQKLPPCLRVDYPENMLTFVGHKILGMNTVQAYLKVPGSRTPGHQENNNFCSVNLNVGPGDCEWFGVENKYWGGIQKLCESKGIQYLQGSWWPDVEECKQAGIPVYRFTQKAGDFVWVNRGCVHWVQALETCNNVAWNVGPISSGQYQLAIERYEWNKVAGFKSLVPMISLSWNMARKCGIRNPTLFKMIKTTMMNSLVHCFKVQEFARRNNVPVTFHGRRKNDISNYCGTCEEEVFNLLVVRKEELRPVVHCVECAQKASANLSGFVILEEYKMESLMRDYNKFRLEIP